MDTIYTFWHSKYHSYHRKHTNRRYTKVMDLVAGNASDVDTAVRCLLLYIKSLNVKETALSSAQQESALRVVEQLDLWLGEMIANGRANFEFVHKLV